MACDLMGRKRTHFGSTESYHSKLFDSTPGVLDLCFVKGLLSVLRGNVALPVSSPYPANRMRHRKSNLLVAQFADGKPTVILFPSSFGSELIEELGAHTP